jgi:hypothetical protein
MGVIPQSPFAYETLPLFLIPSSRFQTYALVIGSDVVLAVYALTRGAERSGYFHTNSTAIVLAMYLPVLVMVLMRPNEGTVPDWLERGSAALPRWLRGASTTAVKPAR